MRYILDDNGYIYGVSSNPIECDNKGYIEYTGSVPEGYDSLEIWATTANIRAYKIVNGNLTYDANRAAALEAEWAVCAYKRNILTARLETSHTIAAANTYETLQLKKWNATGDKLSVNSAGGIVIGSGVKMIKINATIRWHTGTVANKYLTVQNSQSQQLIQAVNYRPSNTGLNILTISDALFNVEEDEVIYIKVYGAANDIVAGTNQTYGMLVSYLTVEVID